MNIVPRLLYLFQMIPVLLPSRALRQLRSAVTTFIWREKRPRLRYSFLSLPSRMGGLAAPSFEIYQLFVQLNFILEWHLDDPNSTWNSAEAAGIRSVPLQTLLKISSSKLSDLVKGNIIINKNFKVWRLARKIEGYSAHLSPSTPLHNNPPGLNEGLSIWKKQGICVIGDGMENDKLMTFDQMITKGPILTI